MGYVDLYMAGHSRLRPHFTAAEMPGIARLEAIADRDGRSLSWIVRGILAAGLECSEAEIMSRLESMAEVEQRTVTAIAKRIIMAAAEWTGR